MEGRESRPATPARGGDGAAPAAGPGVRAPRGPVDPKVFEELGFSRCATCGSLVLEGVCVQCRNSAVEHEPAVLRQPVSIRCSRCSTTFVSGARFCDSCGEAVHASSLALARVRDLRGRLEGLK